MKQRLAALLLTLLLALSALPISTLAAPTPEPIMTPEPTATSELAPEGEPAAPTPELTMTPEPTATAEPAPEGEPAAPTPEPTMPPEPTATAEPTPEGEPAAPTPEPAFVGDPTEEPAPDIMVFIDGTTVAGGAYGDHIRWELSDRGLLTIYGAGAIPDFAAEADMPWAERRGQITALTVEPGITRIGARSFFGCSALQTASLPASVTAVGGNAFFGCAALSEVRYAGTEEAWARVRIDGGNEPLQSASKSFGTETPPVVPVENIVAEGSCGGRVFWKLDDQGVLTVFGEGDFWGVPEYEVNNRWDAPWFDKLRDQVRTAVIEPGVTSVGARAFLDCKNLTAVRIADTVTAIGDYAFSMCTGLTDVTLPDSVTWIGTGAFGGCLNVASIDLGDSLLLIGEAALCGCERLTDVNLPDGLLAIDNRAFEGCIRLARITIPDSVIRMGAYAFHDCNALQTAVLGKGLDRIEAHMFHHCDRLQSVTISESVAWIEEYAFDDCFALTDVYYGGTQEAWKWVSVMKYNEPFLGARMHYGTEDSPYGGYPLEFDIKGVSGETTIVWIDGVPYAAAVGEGMARLKLPDTKAKSAVIYSYNGEFEADRRYPTGMAVWLLEYGADGYRAVRSAQMDNILQYVGSSIRITGKKGIRMITGVPTDMKKRLTGSGVNGWKLEEYGTVVAWADEMFGALVLGAPYAKSAAAYRAGVSDPIFRQAGGLTQYTNVLVGYTDEQCKPQLAMRPYMILQNGSGQTVTLYGGVVYRSIGYIAYQNRAAFKPGTAAYRYIWDIIHSVYGDAYGKG